MRERKFRGKTATGEWVYGYLFEDITESRHLCYIISGGSVPAVSMPSERFIEVEPETVGEFVGLTDKSDTDIYEGDCISGMYGDIECIWVVTFGSDRNSTPAMFCAYPVLGGSNQKMSYNTFPIMDTDFATFDLLIGDIHSNPELTK